MACTHCGVCLESCPTYTLWGEEADSPRGRIVLIEDALAPTGKVSASMASHVDACVGCMACMTACPEDVDFGGLLAAAREAIDDQLARPARERARRRAALTILPHAGRSQRRTDPAAVPHFTPARGSARGRVGFLLGCTQRVRTPEINQAAVAVLAAEGYEVVAPRLPDCCGALEASAGEYARARRRAQSTIDAFASVGGVDHVVSAAGACGASMKQYGELLGTDQARAFSALAVDAHELLVRGSQRSALSPLSLRVAYHDACQLSHAQGLREAPRELLRRIPGLELIELPADAGACCGGPGLYALGQPAAAGQLGARQARAVVDSGAQVVVSGDHACVGQLRRHLHALGADVQVHHPLELLQRALA